MMSLPCRLCGQIALWPVCSADLLCAGSLALSTLAAGSVEDPGETAEASPLTSGKTNKQKKKIHQEPLVEGSSWAGFHSSGPGKAPALSSPKWLSHFNSNTGFLFSKVLIQLDLDLFGWVICLKGIIPHLLTVVICLLRWLKHLFSAIFSPATLPTPTN